MTGVQIPGAGSGPLGAACCSALGLQRLPWAEALGLIIPHPFRFVGGRDRSAECHGAADLASLWAQRCSGKIKSGSPMLFPRTDRPSQDRNHVPGRLSELRQW